MRKNLLIFGNKQNDLSYFQNDFSYFLNNSFNLQMFADDAPGTDPKPTETPTDEKKPEDVGRSEPKYTDEDIDRIIGQKFAAWQKQQEKKTSEAERLGRMTAEEKANERMKALEEKLHGYETAAARAEMMKQGRAMLRDKNINVSDELLSCLIAEDADTTKAAVEDFATQFKAAVDTAVKEALKGEAPKAGSAPTGITKEQILAITDRRERQRLMSENIELFSNGGKK